MKKERKREMVKNKYFGQIVEEGDNAGFFKILRKEDLSSEIVVTLFIFPYLINEFLVRSNLIVLSCYIVGL